MRVLFRILSQATQKNTYQNFPTRKNPEIENFKPPQIFEQTYIQNPPKNPPQKQICTSEL